MIINQKQQELVEELLAYAKKRYPEIQFVKVTASPENPRHLWVWVSGISPDDDDRYMGFGEYVAKKEIDILVDYGYKIQLMMAEDRRQRRPPGHRKNKPKKRGAPSMGK